MLFEHDRGEQRRFEAVRASMINHAAKAALCGAPARLGVVGETIEKSLNGERRPQPFDQPALPCREKGAVPLFEMRGGQKGGRPLFHRTTVFRSDTTSAGVPSLPM